MARETMRTWEYTDDDGHVWNRKVSTHLSSQTAGSPAAAIIGGVESAEITERFPRSMKPRVALCQDAAGYSYRIICMAADALLFTTRGTTVTIFTRDGGSAVTLTQYGNEGERSKHTKKTAA